jgi:hypothetical protein
MHVCPYACFVIYMYVGFKSLCCMFYTPTLNKICICQIYDFERVLLEILGSWSFFLSIPRDNLLL